MGNIIERVKASMTGRMCDFQGNVMQLLEIIERGGDGNYLEIGVLHGGTLCAVGLWKQALGHTGMCVGVDPLNGYYKGADSGVEFGKQVDPVSKVPVTPEVVEQNIKTFGLGGRCKVIRAKSNPLPTEIAGMRFAVTYIDGDHWGDEPYTDFVNVKDITTGFIVFDDHDDEHPSVVEASKKACNDPDWEQYSVSAMTSILRRRNHV